MSEPRSKDADPRIGKEVGEHVIRRVIADGAMGRVYAAESGVGKRVAVKVLHPHVQSDPVAVERFRREYDTTLELAHPHIVEVIEFGRLSDGSDFMVMEFLEGKELSFVFEEEGALGRARALRIVSQLAAALEHAHSFGMIHRDLKPENVFLVGEGEEEVVKVLDFGSVKLQMDLGPKLTAFGTTLGSPAYMSPEQAMGKQDVDGRTDVFACAAIAYEALTGEIPFNGNNVAEILMKVMNTNPPPPSTFNQKLPTKVDDVFEVALAKEKEERFASVKAFANALLGAFGLDNSLDVAMHSPVSVLKNRIDGASERKSSEQAVSGNSSERSGKAASPVPADGGLVGAGANDRDTTSEGQSTGGISGASSRPGFDDNVAFADTIVDQPAVRNFEQERSGVSRTTSDLAVEDSQVVARRLRNSEAPSGRSERSVDTERHRRVQRDSLTPPTASKTPLIVGVVVVVVVIAAVFLLR